ncbi:hypothetical protein Tco_0260843 [Tanacetum coccineum]
MTPLPLLRLRQTLLEPAGAENVINDSALDDPEFNVGVAREACFSTKVRFSSEDNYRERKKFERKYQRQVDLLKEKDIEIANLKAQLSLKETEAAKAIHLRNQVTAIEGTEAAWINELNSLKGRITALEGQLSYDELSIKVASLKSEKDKLTDQVSLLDTTCSGLRDQVLGYELFKEQIEVVQDEQVKVLSDRVTRLDAELMGMDLHLDGEFYPQYLAALGGAIGRAIDKGMQDGLVAGIDHGKAGLGLADVAAYNPFAEANYVFAVNALPPWTSLFLLNWRPKKMQALQILWDQVVIGETSLSFSLDVVHARVQRIRRLHQVCRQFIAATTALSTTFVQASSIPPVPVSAYDAEPHVEAPSFAATVFEKEELETIPELPKTS